MDGYPRRSIALHGCMGEFCFRRVHANILLAFQVVFLSLAYQPARSYQSRNHFEFPLLKAFGGEEVKMQWMPCFWKFLASASCRCKTRKQISMICFVHVCEMKVSSSRLGNRYLSFHKPSVRKRLGSVGKLSIIMRND